MIEKQKYIFTIIIILLILGGLFFAGKIFWDINRPVSVSIESKIPSINVQKLEIVIKELETRASTDVSITTDMSNIVFGNKDPFK